MRPKRWGGPGSSPAELGPKDGLALMSANSMSVGAGALAIDHADATLRLADLAAAASMEACTANPELANAIAASAKPVPGQIETASRLRRLLAGTDLGGEAVSLQDPLSFRVVPQVHGAVRAIIESVRTAVETELGGRNDNPLVAIEERVVVQSANFHPMLMALGFDALRPGLIHVGAISERRMSHLWERVFAGGTPDPGMLASISGGPGLWYSAAARFSELRPLAAPATLGVPPLDLNHEDHATAAPATVAATDRALDLLDDILVCRVDLRPRRDRGSGRPPRWRHSAQGCERQLGRSSPSCGRFPGRGHRPRSTLRCQRRAATSSPWPILPGESCSAARRLRPDRY